MKRLLTIFINTLCTFNNCELNYYQGYHNLALLFLYIFIDDFPTGVLVFQRFSEFILKENLIIQQTKVGYTFNHALNVFNDILKIVHKQTYQNVQKYADGNSVFIISWILSLFSHKVNNIALEMRLIDYFATSHPLAVFFLTAVITKEEVEKIVINFNASKLSEKFFSFFNKKEDSCEELSMTNFFAHFQELNLDEKDFDRYIAETETIMKSIDIQKLMEKYKEVKFQDYYPIMNKEKYIDKLIALEHKNYQLTKKYGRFAYFFKHKLMVLFSSSVTLYLAYYLYNSRN